MLSNTMRLNFSYLTIIYIFYPRYNHAKKEIFYKKYFNPLDPKASIYRLPKKKLRNHPAMKFCMELEEIKCKQKSNRIFIHEITRLIIMKIKNVREMKMGMKKRSHKYGKNKPSFRQGHKYSK